jgi:hypothetical protein
VSDRDGQLDPERPHAGGFTGAGIPEERTEDLFEAQNTAYEGASIPATFLRVTFRR